MAFSVEVQSINDFVAVITLKGELDSSSAGEFKAAIESVSRGTLKRLFLSMGELTYMASAGLRVLIFAKQKMGPDSELLVVGSQEPVLQTIRLTGFHRSVVLLDTLPEL